MVIDVETLENTYHGAIRYHFRAKQYLQAGERSSLIFNVGSVAIENYLIALCEMHGDPPSNHDFAMLTEIAECHVKMPAKLSNGIRSLNDIFGLCSVDHYYHEMPTEDDAQKVLSLCKQLQSLFDQKQLDWIFKQTRKGSFLRINEIPQFSH